MARGDTPVLTMMDIGDGRGHAVLPYKCVQGAGSKPHRIYVADPNVPWRSKAGDPTYIEIRKDNTFKFIGGTSSYESTKIVAGLLPGTLLIDIPFHRLDSQPRTPFWEVLLAMTGLVGMILVFAGDGEVQQLRGDNKELYRTVGGARLMAPNAIQGLARIPVFDVQDPIPELYAQRTPTAKTLDIEVRGKKAGTYSQLTTTAAATIGVEASIAARAVDTLGFERLRREKPLLEVRTTQPTKDARVVYATAPGERLADRRGFAVSVTVAKDAVARVGIAPRGRSLLLESAGSVKPIDLELRTDVGGATKKAKFQVKPQSVSDVFRFNPNWDAVGAETVVERLSSFEGAVLDRERLRSK
jgi:hypothetical protein